ncbi:MAG: hypothetical protein JST22_19870 [Bacteroidetes bacterium]|nr:hypothetical protein [Bacteroidota bacterium]
MTQRGTAQQFETLLGAGGGYETGTLRFDNPNPPFGQPILSNAGYPEGHLLLWIPRLAGDVVGTQLRVGWHRAKSTFAFSQDILVLQNGAGVTATQTIAYDLDFEMLRAELLAALELPAGFAIGAGPTVGNYLAMNGRLTHRTVTPPDTRFPSPDPDNGKVITASEGEVKDRSHVSLGAMGSLMYTLHIGDRLAVIPEVHARREFTDLSPYLSWNGFIFGGGLNVAWVLGSEPGR